MTMIAYIPVVSILLYAQAALGPEYEYPACLRNCISKLELKCAFDDLRSNNGLAALDWGFVFLR